MATDAGKKRIVGMIEDRLFKAIMSKDPEMKLEAGESVREFVERFRHRLIFKPTAKRWFD